MTILVSTLFLAAVTLQMSTRSTIRSADLDVWNCSKATPGTDIAHSQVGSKDLWKWACVPTAAVKCDSPSHEPVDLEFPQCEDLVLMEMPVRRLNVAWNDGRPLSIEWRKLPVQGSTTQIAFREYSPNPDAHTVLFLSRTERLMRFKRPGAAPLSVLLPASSSDAELSLPEAEAGGELLLLNVVPTVGEVTDLDISGQGAMRVKLDSTSRAARARLFAGEFEGRLVFSSGLRSEPRTFRIETGLTTELLRETFKPRSELVLAGDPELSNYQPTSLTLYRVTSTNGSSERTLIWKTDRTPPSLLWRIDGLEAGTYEAQLSNDAAPLASTAVELGESQSAQARLAAPSVQIEGSVVIGSAPAPAGTKIHFEVDKQRFEAITDERGGYRVRAGKPGKYTARIESGKYLWTWTDSVSFVEGFNRFDWKIPGGSLRITLKREDGKSLDETVQLQCYAKGFHSAGPIMPNEVGEPIVLLGLPFEAIKCSAETKSSLVSDELLVKLTPATPSIDSTLRLRSLAGKVDLRDALGNPLSGARVVVGNLTLDEDPPASGQYSLVRSVPGAGMLITAKGQLPMCRQLKESDFPLLRLSMVSSGTKLATIRLTPQASRPPGLMHGVPGSECPIPLFAFEPVLRSFGAKSTDILLTLPEGNFQYQPYGLFPLQSFTVPGPPLELTRPK